MTDTVRTCHVWCLLGVLMALTAPCVARGDDATTAYFEQLRRRNLFELAERYAEHRLRDENLNPRLRLTYTIELSRTLFDHGAHLSADERAAFWSEADEWLVRLERHSDAAEFQPLVAAQRGRLLVDAALWLADDCETRPGDATCRRALADAAVRASLELAKARKLLAEQKKKANAASLPILSAGHANVLDDQMAYGKALLRIRAAEILLPVGPERAAEIRTAESEFRDLLGPGHDAETAILARIGLAACRRILGDVPGAEANLTAAIGANSPSREARERLLEEQVRLAWSRDRPDESTAALLEYRGKSNDLSGRVWWLHVLSLEKLSEVARQRGDAELAKDLDDEITQMSRRLSEQFGGVWSRRVLERAELSRLRAEFGPELGVLAQEVAAARATGDIAASRATLERAVRTARETRRSGAVTHFARELANLEIGEERWQQAYDTLREAADQESTPSTAAELDLLATWCLGRLYDASPTESRRIAYSDALANHRKRFAESSTRHDAEIMLARLEEQRLQCSRAIPLYLGIPRDHRRADEAAAGAGRCFLALIQSARRQNVDAADFERQADSWFGEQLKSLPPAAEWSAAQTEFVTSLMQWAAISRPPRFNDILKWTEQVDRVNQAHQGDANWPAQQLREATAIPRLLALAATGQTAAARNWLEHLGKESGATFTRVLKELGAMQEREADPNLNRQLAELRREALNVHDRIAPNSQETPALTLERARIEMETGDPGRGLGRLNQLMNEHPKDQPLLNQIAELLAASEDRRAASLELECRKLQEAALQQGTPAWLTARLDVIQALLKNSRLSEAKKLLTVTELVYRAPLAEPQFAERVNVLKEKITKNP
ncbi:MAG: hypothetical protein KF777_17695 [Planctomycetaceae bacterium]|nr:hypothetical protein [Planctomycetaceae bacterium]